MERTSRGVVRTCGEIFGDGAIIELIRSASDHRVLLLLWHDQLKKVAPQIEHNDRLYGVSDADHTLLQAIRFASDAQDYCTAQKLFVGICELFARYIGLAAPEAALLTAWSCSTWFPECVSSPPTLVISGPDMGQAVALLRLLSCLVRRSLVLADINRSGLLAVTSLQPTLLVNQPGKFPKLWHLFGTSNFHGVYVPATMAESTISPVPELFSWVWTTPGEMALFTSRYRGHTPKFCLWTPSGKPRLRRDCSLNY